MAALEDVITRLTDAAARIPSKELSRLNSLVAAAEANEEPLESGQRFAHGHSWWVWIDLSTFPEEYLKDFNAMIPDEGQQGFYAYDGDLTPLI
jgi:hypothetical protein